MNYKHVKPSEIISLLRQQTRGEKWGNVLLVAWIFYRLLDYCHHLTPNHHRDSPAGWIPVSETQKACA